MYIKVHVDVKNYSQNHKADLSTVQYKVFELKLYLIFMNFVLF